MYYYFFHIMRDLETGNSRDFGFISYYSFDASDAAIEAMNGQYLCKIVKLRRPMPTRKIQRGNVMKSLLTSLLVVLYGVCCCFLFRARPSLSDVEIENSDGWSKFGSLFPNRAPKDWVLLLNYIGGATNTEILSKISILSSTIKIIDHTTHHTFLSCGEKTIL
ncbi:hypothetical protein P3S67_012897 [Capsicum chacoense]